MSKSLPATLLLILALQPAWACSNYSQTELDDRAVRDAIDTSNQPAFDLISWQFPHHGRAYWSALERDSRQRLSGYAPDPDAPNDLAVAVLKQGRYDEARAMLLELLAADPHRYQTLSNLGVLEKKAGNYARAADYLQRALTVRPGGHMGLGDFYLRAARWQGTKAPQHSILGQPYHPLQKPAVPGLSDAEVKLYLETLIHNDRALSDVYLVYGDWLLLEEKEPLLAGYAYAQARRRGHPADAVLDARFEAVRERMVALAGPMSRRLDVREAMEAKMIEHLDGAENWIGAFEAEEARLLESKPVAEVTLQSVQIDRHRLSPLIQPALLPLYEAPDRWQRWPEVVAWGLGALALGLGVVWLKRRVTAG